MSITNIYALQIFYHSLEFSNGPKWQLNESHDGSSLHPTYTCSSVH